MRRKLILLNLALAALVGAAGWQIRAKWEQARAREHRILAQAAPPATMATPAPAAAPQPVQAAGYLEVAEKLLFAKDRNSTVVIEETAPKPMPPLPAAHGVLDFGGGATVILSEKQGAQQRRYMAGDQVGEFKIVSVSTRELVFDWEGQEIRKAVEELVDRKTPTEPVAAAPAPAAAPPTAMSKTIATQPEPTGPGIDVGGPNRACSPGDTSPAGTVREGYRKAIRPSAVGVACMWEPLR